MACLIETAKEWQTLIAGVLAIFAAGLGGAFVWSQTTAQQRAEEHRLKRQHAGARAVLPLALSSCIEWAEACGHGLKPIARLADETIPKPARSSYAPPILDPTLIGPLREAVETGDPELGDRVAVLIEEIQILISRLRTVATRTSSDQLVLKSNIEEFIVNAASVHARAGALFVYARRRTDNPPDSFPSEKELFTSLNIMGFVYEIDHRVYERAKLSSERR